MENSIKSLDVSIVTWYLGRYSTLLAAVAVLGLTISALMTTGGMRNQQPLMVGVPNVGTEAATFDYYEPLRSLLSRHTSRPVRLVACGPDWPRSCSLYLMPFATFIENRSPLALEGIYSIPRHATRDGAAFIAVAASGSPPLESIAFDDVLFASPRSLNGCWVQLSALASSKGKDIPPLSDLHFAGSAERAGRVLYEVLCGKFRVGACQISTLEDAYQRGDLARGEIKVINTQPSLPEVVMAVRSEEASYFADKLERTRAVFYGESGSPGEEAEVALLKHRGVGGMLPLSDDDLRRADDIFALMEKGSMPASDD